MHNQKVSLPREIWVSDSHFDGHVFWDVTLRNGVNHVQNRTRLDIMPNRLNPE